jgi:hypothetical protein
MSSAPAQDQTEQLQATVPKDNATSSSSLRLRFRKMPLWIRYGVTTIVLIAIILAVYTAVPVEQAHLQIICQHSFRSAQLTVLVDGSAVYSSNMNVASKKRLGILPRPIWTGSFFQAD